MGRRAILAHGLSSPALEDCAGSDRSETGAEQRRHEQADDHPERKIAHQVAEFDMQSESGDGSPPFAVENAAGVRSARG